jgi:hypothetical protein
MKKNRRPVFELSTYTVDMDSHGAWPRGMEVSYRWIDDSDDAGANYYIHIERIMIDGVLMDDWMNDDCYEQIVTDIETYWEEVSYDE